MRIPFPLHPHQHMLFIFLHLFQFTDSHFINTGPSVFLIF
jgi:hypothetical protein